MAERFVGIDVALHEHRIAIMNRDGEAVGSRFNIAVSQGGAATRAFPTASAPHPLLIREHGLMMRNNLHGIRGVRVLGLRTLHAGVEGLEEPDGVRLEEPHVQIVVME
jgi:hypothetical protein